jgi:hypothetical protein
MAAELVVLEPAIADELVAAIDKELAAAVVAAATPTSAALQPG